MGAPRPGHYNRFLLPDNQRARIKVVLVSPRNPLNIGAVARAIANFGFSHLAVVAPYMPHWREARSAIGAPEILKNAQTFQSLADAIADCALVLGTGTLTRRKPEQEVIQLPEIGRFVSEHLDPTGQVALVFGPEKHGLTRDDLSYCHALVQIPTDSAQPSMNLGQAAAVCLYVLAVEALAFATELSSPPLQGPPGKTREPSAASKHLEILARVIEQVMEKAHYSPTAMQNANQHDLRLLLRKFAPSEKDARRMLGLFRRILWRLQH